jgi:hypothetical protein
LLLLDDRQGSSSVKSEDKALEETGPFQAKPPGATEGEMASDEEKTHF